MTARRLHIACSSFMLVAVMLCRPLPAEPLAGSAPDANDLRAWITDLNSEEYEVRQRAIDQLKRLAAQPDDARKLTSAIQQVLAQGDVSFEVRAVLEPIAARLPAAPRNSASPAAPGECEQRLAELRADSFAVREAAAVRLAQLIVSPPAAAELLTRLKASLADPRLSGDVRRRVAALYDRARGAWLTGDESAWRLPEVSEQEIDGHISRLAGTYPTTVAWEEAVALEAAERELLDLLARSDFTATVQRKLQERLKMPGLDVAAEARLRGVLDWAQPAMVAECWNAGRHTGIQHLVLGVPNQPAGAVRPSLFDRCDDRTAHCVSGNSLSPGDHPVGVLFPHPKAEMATAQFHLVNLPTPRRRMAYEYQSQRPEAERLAAATARTLAAVLQAKRALSAREILMLQYLDAPAVSRFVGPYFMAVDDQPAQGVEEFEALPATSLHSLCCVVLARCGTHEALDGLVQAIQNNRFRPAGTSLPKQLPWQAALGIAARESWSGKDTWLARIVPLRDALSDDPEPGDAGATAAATLLTRHSQPLEKYHLKAAPASNENSFPVGYRFTDEGGRAAVMKWWEGRAAAQARR